MKDAHCTVLITGGQVCGLRGTRSNWVSPSPQGASPGQSEADLQQWSCFRKSPIAKTMGCVPCGWGLTGKSPASLTMNINVPCSVHPSVLSPQSPCFASRVPRGHSRRGSPTPGALQAPLGGAREWAPGRRDPHRSPETGTRSGFSHFSPRLGSALAERVMAAHQGVQDRPSCVLCTEVLT